MAEMNNPQLQGTVQRVEGNAWVRHPDGSLVVLKPGDRINPGDVIVTGHNAHVEIARPIGSPVDIGPDRTVLADQDVLGQSAPDKTEAAILPLDTDADRVIAALNAGQDPFATLEAPAAGLIAGGADSGHGFVRLLRIVEDVTPFSISGNNASNEPEVLRPAVGGSDDSILQRAPEEAPNSLRLGITTAGDSVNEGGTITYTVTVGSPVTGVPLVVTLDSGLEITIPVGATSATSAPVPVRGDDIYAQPNDAITRSITSATGGGFTSYTPGNPVTTLVVDDGDATTVSLAATPSVAEGGSIVYTASLSNPAATPLSVTLSNGLVINIAAGASAGSASTAAPGDDVYLDASLVSVVINSTSAGGGFESLVIDATPAITAITDTVDTMIVSLTATASVIEGGTITYTASIPAPVTGTPVTVTLSNGATITIPVGGSSGQISVVSPITSTNGASTASAVINVVSGGNFENLVPSGIAANTNITDSAPTAVADSGSVTEDTVLTTSGSVLANDTVGADANATPITPASVTLTYGSLVLGSDGAYTYTLNNNLPAVNALNNGQSLTDSYTYTLTDGDGTTTTAVLTITINGNTDGGPTLNIPDTNGAAPGEMTLPETAAATPGTFTITAAAGLASISFDGTPVSAAQLNNLSTTPVSINTIEGTLLLTAFNPATGLVSYTYDPRVQSVNGPVTDSIAIVVTDTLGGTSAPNSLDIVITDSAPTAVADSGSVTEDTVLTTSGSVLANDTVGADANATPITPASVTLTYGSLVLGSDGAYTYTLNNNLPAVNALNNGQSLTDSYTYTLTDGDGTTTTAVLTITINGNTDGGPTLNIPDTNGAAPGEMTLPETAGATPGTFTITTPAGLASITFDNAPPVSAAQLNNLSTTPVSINTIEGTLVLTGFNPATGLVSYTYDPRVQNVNGPVTDTIAIVVTDTLGGTSAPNSLDVLITDSAPTAVADSGSVTEDTSLTVSSNVLTNDTVGADANATPITPATVTLTYGSLVLGSDGAYTYTLNNNLPAVNALNNGQSLTDSYTYTLTDGDGTTTTAVLTITINGSTDGGPTLVIPDTNGAAPGEMTLPETAGATPGTFTITTPAGLASITFDNAPPVSAAQLNNLSTTPVSINTIEGTLVLTGFNPATGLVSYTYDPRVQNVNGPVTDTIAIVVTDTLGGTSAPNSLDVLITDSAPTAVADSGSVTEDTSLTVSSNVLTNDTVGADANATPITPATVTLTYGSLVLGSDGAYTYTLNNNLPAVNALNNGQSLTDSYTYTLTDGDGTTTTAVLTITINGSTDGGPTLVIPDTNGAAPGEMTLPETAGATPGTFTITTPAGLASITFDNAPPVSAAQLNNLSTTPVSINTIEGTLVLTGFNPATGLVSYTYDPRVQNVNGPVTDTIAIVVTDTLGGTSAPNSLDVLITDSAPTAVADSGSVTEDTSLTVSSNVLTNDTVGADANATPITPATVTLTYGSLVLGSDGAYTYTLNNNLPAVNALNNGQSLTDSYTYTLTDGDGTTTTAVLTITINGSTDGGPTLVIPDTNGAAPGEMTLPETAGATPGTFTITTPAGLASITFDNAPPVSAAQLNNLSTTPVSINTIEGTLVLTGFNPATGLVSYTYDPRVQNVNGPVTDSIAIVVTDTLGGTSAPNSLDVLITDSAPTAVADSGSVTEDTSLTVSSNVLTNDTVGADANATPITPATVTLTYGSLVLGSDGAYTYTLNNNLPAVNALNNGQSLTDSYTYTLTDGDGTTTTAVLTITINGSTDGGPTLVIPDTNGAAPGEMTLPETAGATPGTFTITTPAGLASITFDNAPPVSAAQLNNLSTTPVSINTIEGTLVLTGFNPATGLVSYTYDPRVQNVNGPVTDTIAIVVTDTLGGTSAPNSLDVLITDSAPTAVADSGSVTEDTSLTVSSNVLTNDTVGADANATPITPATVTLTYGSLVLGSDGAYTYTLNNNLPAVNALNNGQSLTDSYTYTLTDGDGTTTTAVLTITINGSTDGGPTLVIPDTNGAAPGEMTLPETAGATPGTFTITTPAGLASITFDNAPPVSAAQLNNLSTTPVSINTIEGTLVLTGFNPATGLVSYTYDPRVQNVNGPVTDTIAIVVTDTLGGTSAPNSLDVLITDSAPTAVADSGSVTEDTSLTVSSNVLTNDTVGADANATPITPATVTLTYGSLVLGSDGAYTYTLNNNLPAVNALNNGQSLTDSYTYTLTDGDGTTTTAVLTITINGSTDGGPTLVIPDTNGAAPGEMTLPETAGATPGTFTITTPAGLASITFDNAPPVSAAQLNNLSTTPVSINTIEGTLVLTGFNPATGLVSYTYDPRVQNVNGPVTDTIAIVVTDTLGGTSAPNSLDVLITDSAPTAVADSGSVTEDTSLTVSSNVLTNDTVGADANATPITPATVTLTYGSLVLGSDGAYTYTLNNNLPAVNALNNGQSLTDSYTYTLTDGDGTTTTAVLTITINGSTDGGPTLVIPDTNGAAPGEMTLPETAGATPGTFTITTPAGLASITFDNAPPVSAAQLNNLSTTPVSINTIEGTLVLTGFNPATGLVSYTYDPRVQNVNGPVTDTIAIVVTDTLGGTSAPNSLDVLITDSAPTAVADSGSVTEDTSLTVSSNVLTNDTVGADANATPITPATVTLTYGSLVLGSDGAYTYTLNNNLPAVNALNNGQSLTDSYTYTLTDGDGTTTTAVLTITINGSTDGGPTLVIPDTNGAAPGEMTLPETAGATPGTFTITTPAGLASITFDNAPPVSAAQLNNLSTTPVSINTIEGTLVLTGFNPATGLVSYTYDPRVQNVNGPVTDTIAIVVTDTLGGTSAPNSLDVLITDSAPTAVADSGSVTEDTSLTVSSNVLTNDTVGADANATPITPASVTLTYGSLVLGSDGAYTYTLNNNLPAVNALNNGQSLTDSYTYTLTDGDGTTTTAVLTITINGNTDGGPTLNIPDTNGAAPGEMTLPETAGATPGTFTITTPAGLASITFDNAPPVSAAQLNNLSTTPVSINTIEGTLVLTGFNPATGLVSYTYDPRVQSVNGPVTDSIAIVVTDTLGGTSAPNSLDIVITDSAPTAVADSGSVTEDTVLTTSGSVLANDTVGADANATPITPATVTLTYGSLVLGSDGAYTYTLNNNLPAVNALNNGQSLTDSYTYTLTDGDGTTTTAVLTITINGSTDGGPTLVIPDTNGAAPGEMTLPETAGATPGTFTITTPAGLASITFDNAPPVSAAQLNNLSTTPVSINTIEGTLVLTGFNPATGLVSYTYDPRVQNVNGPVTDTIAIVVTDTLGGTSAPNSLDVLITDSAPTAVADSGSVTEDTSLTVSSNVLTNDTVGADANATPITPATVTLTYGSLVLGSDGAYTYTLNNNLPAVNALNNGQSLTDSYTYTLTDGDGTTTTAVLTITINGTNDAPTLDLDGNNSSGATGANYTTSFVEAGAGVTGTGAIAIVDIDRTIADVDSANLTGATVTLTNLQAGDVLAVGTLPAGITAVITGGNVVTLSGSSSLANYQTALSAITFNNTSDTPNITPRTITVVVTDGTNASNTATTTINVTASNDAPTLDLDNNNSSGAAGANYTTSFVEAGAGVTGTGAIAIVDIDRTIADVDSANLTGATVTLTNLQAGDVLAVGTLPAGITAVITGGNVVTLSGSSSLANYQTALSAITFNNTSDTPNITPRTITVVVTDGTNASNTATTTINVTASNDAPTLDLDNNNSSGAAGANYTTSFVEAGAGVTGTGAIAIVDIDRTIADVDSANLTGATVTLTNLQAGDVLAVGTLPAGITAVITGGNVVTLSGSSSLANYQTALSAITFNNTSDTPNITPRTITVVVTDGTNASNTATTTINVTASNDAPTLDLDNNNSSGAAGANYTTSFVEAGAGVTGTGAIAIVDIDRTIADVDSANLTGATVTLTNLQAGDVLAVGTLPAGITAVITGGNVVTLSGSSSLANYQTALSAITFNNTSDTPNITPRTITVVVTDGTNASNTATTTINVTASNDAPTLDLDNNNSSGAAGANYTTSFVEAGAGVTGTGAIAIVDIDRTIADVDSANLTGATVTLTNLQAGDVLAVGTLPAGITAVITGGNVVTLSGSSSLANYQTALSAITFNNTSDTPNITPRTITVVVTDGTNASNTATTTINVTASNDAPTLDLDNNNSSGAAGANYTTSFVEAGAGVTGTGAIAIVDIDRTIADVDSANLTGATVTLTNLQAGDVLAVGTLPAGITAVITGGNVVTLSGSSSLANYQTALSAITFNNTSDTPNITPRTITVVVTDGTNASNTATTTINVTASNDAPTTNDIIATGNEDTLITVTLSGADVDGTVVGYVISTLPANGTLYSNAAGTTVVAAGSVVTGPVYFRPSVDWNGSTSFLYAARDNSNLTDASAATATINVTAVNDGPPVATNDTFATVLGTPIVITQAQLLSNDTLRDHAIINGTGVATGGTLLNNGDGTYTFTPTAAGTGSFTYTLRDDDGQTSTATVSITTYATRDDLITVNESALSDGTGGGTRTASGNLLANDPGATSITSVGGVTDGSANDTDTRVGYVGVDQKIGLILVGNMVVDVAGAGLGDYTYTLLDNANNSAAANNNSITLPIAYVTNTGTANAQITIVDDRPIAYPRTINVAEGTMPSYNLMLVLDTSRSMILAEAGGQLQDEASNGTVKASDRLTLAKEAMVALVSAYFDQASSVAVKIVTFGPTAMTLNGGAAYTDKAALIAAISGIAVSPTGGTNYEAALTAATTAFGTPSGATQNVSYFISDGNPTAGNTNTAVTNWDAFTASRTIRSYALGIGGGINSSATLNTIHNVDSDRSGTRDAAIIVPDLNDLAATLTTSVPVAYGGRVVGASSAVGSALGADDGWVQSITLQLDTNANGAPDTNVTFTYNQGTNQISWAGGFPAGSPITGDTLALSAARGFVYGNLTFNFATGTYAYYTGAAAAAGTNFSVNFVAQDGDGDVTPSTALTFNVIDGKPIAHPDFDTLTPNGTGFTGNVMTGIGTDDGLATGTLATDFTALGAGADTIVDGARISSISFLGSPINLTAASGNTALGGGTYTVSATGVFTWTHATNGSSLTFNRDGYYNYTPATADLPNPPLAALSTVALTAAPGAATGLTVSGRDELNANATITYNGSGAGVTGSGVTTSKPAGDQDGVNDNNQIDGLETMVFTFATATHPHGVENLSFTINNNSNLGSTAPAGSSSLSYDIYHIDGHLLGTFVGASNGLVTLPSIYSNVGRIEVQASSDAEATISNIRFQSVLDDISTTVVAPVTIGYTLTDTDGDSSNSTLTLNSYNNATAGDAGNNTLNGSAINDQLYGLDGNDTINGGAGNDLLVGGAGNDSLLGGAGDDKLFGSIGNDTLDGGIGNDRLIGGSGNDIMTGGTGSDTFVWSLADRGAAGTPAVDTITAFDNATAAAGGDVLDLRDLLQGETHAGTDSGTLSNYMHFTTAGGNTTVQISSAGGFVGGYNAGAVDQSIVLQGVDLTNAGALATDAAIIQDLLTKGKLQAD